MTRLATSFQWVLNGFWLLAYGAPMMLRAGSLWLLLAILPTMLLAYELPAFDDRELDPRLVVFATVAPLIGLLGLSWSWCCTLLNVPRQRFWWFVATLAIVTLIETAVFVVLWAFPYGGLIAVIVLVFLLRLSLAMPAVIVLRSNGLCIAWAWEQTKGLTLAFCFAAVAAGVPAFGAVLIEAAVQDARFDSESVWWTAVQLGIAALLNCVALAMWVAFLVATFLGLTSGSSGGAVTAPAPTE